MRSPCLALALLCGGLLPGAGAFGGLPHLGHGWCTASPPQLCRRLCRPVTKPCPAAQCAMRQGTCCEYTCQAEPAAKPTLQPTSHWATMCSRVNCCYGTDLGQYPYGYTLPIVRQRCAK